MSTLAEPTQSSKNKSADNTVMQRQDSRNPTFQFVDSRTEAPVQRKLQAMAEESPQVVQLRDFQTMANRASSQQSSGQRPSGGFGEIATAMGQQYGVDTSSLKFTTNSSFPATVGAAATIQGRDIHFAPGHDTTNTIKHEVGHYIDNTINGTPKGDAVVNGHTVDTTREQAVDDMAKAPLQQKALSNKDSENSMISVEDTKDLSRVIQLEKDANKHYNESLIRDNLGNAFGDKGTQQANESHKKYREEDTNLRLQSSEMKACHLDEIPENATWDFKNWMVEGEMPPTFGYGFFVRDYFKALTREDRNKFIEEAHTMRSSTMITKTLGAFKPQSDQLKDNQNEKVEKAFSIAADARSQGNVDKANKLVNDLFSENEDLKDKVFVEIVKMIEDDKNQGLLAAMGDQMWLKVAQLGRSSDTTEKENWKKASKWLGSRFLHLGRYLQNQLEDGIEESIYTKLKQNLGYVARAWGDATAALGADPWGNILTDSFSSTIPDYKDGGVQFAYSRRQLVEAGGGKAWCDMDINESMWSKAANYDRYRDTKVHLHTPNKAGADVANPKEDIHNLRVTHQELQLGSDWAAFGKDEEAVAKESAFDYQSDKVGENVKLSDKNKSRQVGSSGVFISEALDGEEAKAIEATYEKGKQRVLKALYGKEAKQKAVEAIFERAQERTKQNARQISAVQKPTAIKSQEDLEKASEEKVHRLADGSYIDSLGRSDEQIKRVLENYLKKRQSVHLP